MKIHIADHPLITHKLTVLRDEKTDSPTFRRLTEEIVTLLAYEAMREIKTHPVTVKTPVANASGELITKPLPVVVPILRAGLGMLEGMSRLVPTAEIGFLGMVRDEKTLKASTYANRLPEDLTNRQCYILDPMLATGGTLVAAIEFLASKGAVDITAICILAAPEGIATLEKAFAQSKLNLKLVTGALDEKLNEKGYIVPGLGDAGDRLYGVV
ncbi:MAG: uracil phosphoribosyltransferase, partial [Actinobacteria bacterium]|nr:uracil phosphoribosyltransferase [Actinomycetota bacterium]